MLVVTTIIIVTVKIKIVTSYACSVPGSVLAHHMCSQLILTTAVSSGVPAGPLRCRVSKLSHDLQQASWDSD